MIGASNLPLGSHYEAAGFYNIIDGPHFTSMCYTAYGKFHKKKICNKHFTIKFEVLNFARKKSFLGALKSLCLSSRKVLFPCTTSC